MFIINSLTKEKMILALPIIIDNFLIRENKREDIDNYANWPMYEGYNSMFNSSVKGKTKYERDIRWNTYKKSMNAVSLVVDNNEEKTIGKFVLVDIDWEKKKVGNMSIRMHPYYCAKGIGTLLLNEILNYCFRLGLNEINLDVLGTNIGAIMSYEKCGFEVLEERIVSRDMFLFMRASRA